MTARPSHGGGTLPLAHVDRRSRRPALPPPEQQARLAAALLAYLRGEITETDYQREVTR